MRERMPDYPPEYDEGESHCEVCLRDEYECVCPECPAPECMGACGDLDCYGKPGHLPESARPAPPEPPVPTIAPESWFDEGTYTGNGEDGGYAVAAGSGDRWYVSVLLDCDSGGFCMVTLDTDGPWKTEEDALQAGEDHVLEWMIDNGLNLPNDEEN